MTTKKMVIDALEDALRRHGNGISILVPGEGTLRLYEAPEDGFYELREVSGTIRHRFSNIGRLADYILKSR